jgi:hypothetical protein
MGAGILIACVLMPVAVVPTYRFLRTKNALRVYWIVLLGGITALPLILALESANTIGWFGFFSGRSAHSIFVRSHRGAGKLAGDRGVSRQSVVLQ